MLGEQFGELKGKIAGQMILDAEGPEAIGKIDSSGTVRCVGHYSTSHRQMVKSHLSIT
jgi:hypothetical protein